MTQLVILSYLLLKIKRKKKNKMGLDPINGCDFLRRTNY